MKRTLITIALTTVVVLTLVEIASFPFRTSSFNTISRSLSYGSGGGGAPVEMPAAAQAPAMQEAAPAPALDSFNSAPQVGNSGGDATALGNAVSDNSNVTDSGKRLVIKNADLALVVKDPKADMTRISALADDLGGFVVSSNLYQSNGANNIEVPEATITIRVPSDKLDQALASIKEGVVNVDSENVSGQDVTSQYVDLQSRLSAKQAAEKKLIEIMDSATKAPDVLAVYNELQQIESDIEVLKGQIKYYEESASLSAISVRLIAEAGTQPIAIGPWKPQGAAKQAVQDLIYFFQNFVDFLIRFLIFNLPALILVAIPLLIVFFLGRAIYRRVRKPNAKLEEKEIEKK